MLTLGMSVIYSWKVECLKLSMSRLWVLMRHAVVKCKVNKDQRERANAAYNSSFCRSGTSNGRVVELWHSFQQKITSTALVVYDNLRINSLKAWRNHWCRFMVSNQQICPVWNTYVRITSSSLTTSNISNCHNRSCGKITYQAKLTYTPLQE